jgi:hypothetical protein
MPWIVVSDCDNALGLLPATAGDSAYLADCVAAANELGWRRRWTSGYLDDPDVVPDQAVKLGTIQYAVFLYRQRGAVDGTLAAFDDFGHVIPTGATWGEILRLWGCNRPVGIY